MRNTGGECDSGQTGQQARVAKSPIFPDSIRAGFKFGLVHILLDPGAQFESLVLLPAHLCVGWPPVSMGTVR